MTPIYFADLYIDGSEDRGPAADQNLIILAFIMGSIVNAYNKCYRQCQPLYDFIRSCSTDSSFPTYSTFLSRDKHDIDLLSRRFRNSVKMEKRDPTDIEDCYARATEAFGVPKNFKNVAVNSIAQVHKERYITSFCDRFFNSDSSLGKRKERERGTIDGYPKKMESIVGVISGRRGERAIAALSDPAIVRFLLKRPSNHPWSDYNGDAHATSPGSLDVVQHYIAADSTFALDAHLGLGFFYEGEKIVNDTMKSIVVSPKGSLRRFMESCLPDPVKLNNIARIEETVCKSMGNYGTFLQKNEEKILVSTIVVWFHRYPLNAFLVTLQSRRAQFTSEQRRTPIQGRGRGRDQRAGTMR